MYFEKPLDIVSDGAGKVFIADVGIPGVFVYDLNQGLVTLLGKDKGTTLFVRPVSLALDEQGTLYVYDAEKKAVQVLDKNERIVRTLDLGKHLASGGGMTYDRTKRRLICVDTRGHKVLFFDLDGNLLNSFGKRGEDDGDFNYPGPVTTNSKGDVIVGDSMNGRISKWQLLQTGQVVFRKIFKFYEYRKVAVRFTPIDVAIDSANRVFVCDQYNSAIRLFDADGKPTKAATESPTSPSPKARTKTIQYCAMPLRAIRATSLAVSKPRPNSSPTGYICQL